MMLVIAMVFGATSCSLFGEDSDPQISGDAAITNQNDGDDAEAEDEEFTMHEGDGVFHQEEVDGAEIEKIKSDPEDFVGKWVGTSDRAVLLYGNVELDIKSDHTWTGNITDEKLKGTWKDKGGYLHMKNDLFSFDLVFDKPGNLLLVESDGENEIYTVLTKQE